VNGVVTIVWVAPGAGPGARDGSVVTSANRSIRGTEFPWMLTGADFVPAHRQEDRPPGCILPVRGHAARVESAGEPK